MASTVLQKMLVEGYELKKAQALIMAGMVFVNGRKIANGSEKISQNEEVQVKLAKEWVSRGAYKLMAALDAFKLNLESKTILDIGSSTGGFSQVALAQGAMKVYALDVGTNQLDFSLRSDSRVTVMEKTNIKHIRRAMFDPLPEVALCDVSFISLKHVFKALHENLDNVLLMALIKPQFEANSNEVERGGFVPPEMHDLIIAKVKAHAQECNYTLIGLTKSPLVGHVAKNVEYLSLWKRSHDE